MKGNKIDRVGEVNYNNFGSKMVIVGYRKYSDIDIYFPKYNWTFKNAKYQKFKNGNIKCPYERRYFGIGYLGEGKYKVCENGKNTKCYDTWNNMLKRCYDSKLHEKFPTYKNCKVCNEWLNYQNFAEWYYNNYYEIEEQKMCLDKDILYKGNKIYSPDNCVFVPNNINSLFTKSDKTRGDYPIGSSLHKRDNVLEVWCSTYEDGEKNKKYLG